MSTIHDEAAMSGPEDGDEAAVRAAALQVLAAAPRLDAQSLAARVQARLSEEGAVVSAAEQVLAAAPAVDASRVAVAVQARLRQAEVTHRADVRQFRRWSVGAAAAAAVLLAVVIPRVATRGQPEAGRAAIAIPELEGLGAAELSTVLDAVDQVELAPAPVPEGVEGLDAHDVDQLIKSLEG